MKSKEYKLGDDHYMIITKNGVHFYMSDDYDDHYASHEYDRNEALFISKLVDGNYLGTYKVAQNTDLILTDNEIEFVKTYSFQGSTISYDYTMSQARKISKMIKRFFSGQEVRI